MLYISAQPDTTYFIWQLELQLRNFKSFDIKKENIHVLIAYDKELGLNPKFKEFLLINNHLATFYPYPDLRVESKYKSSVRPNILKQHFAKFPDLEFTTFMYHDSDILLSRIPQTEDTDANEICIVSDTRNYLDINYVRSVGSEKLLDDMLNCIGLDKGKLEKEDKNTGGAQYILNGIKASFWEKIEKDSENLFFLMNAYNVQTWEKDYPSKKEYRSRKKGIQAWCADMWAVLWNLWLMSKKVEIHKEMDFSWPYDGLDQWHKKAIQHYSGNIEDKSIHFKKTEYLNYMPWYDSDLNHIPNTTCSYEIVKLIKARRIELDDARTSFYDTVIFLETEQADSVTRSTFEIHKNYIQKYLNINVLLLSKSINDQLNNKDEIILTHELCQLTEVLANCNSFIVIPLAHLIKIDELTQLISSPIINQSFSSDKHYKIDMLFNEAFSKMLEIELFEENKGKLNIVQKQDPILKLNSSYIKYYQNNYREIVQSMLSPLGVTYLLP